MNHYIYLILVAMLVSLVCGFIVIPMIQDYCRSKRLFDQPNARKVHKKAIPRLGGISFLPSMLIGFLLAVFVMGYQYHGRILQINLWSVCFMVSATLIYIMGLMDDVLGLNPQTKFIVQIVAACILPAAGLYINDLGGLLGINAIPFWVGAPMTVFVIVFVCNAMNLIDGIDGLCACLSEIALGGFLYAFYREGLYVYCILIGSLMGVLTAYLRFNLFASAASGRKIFMGDSGSLTLGFILAFLFVKLSMNNPQIASYDEASMPLALSLLIVPTFDVARVIIHRLRTHRPMFKADKNHIHHKLMRYGLSMHQTLAAILALDLSFLAINYFVFHWLGFTAMLIIDIALYVAFHYALDFTIINKIRKEELSL